MLLVGAGGHLLEMLDVLYMHKRTEVLCVYDDISRNLGASIYSCPLIKSLPEAEEYFKQESRFVLALGNPLYRKNLAAKLAGVGGKLTSIISPRATIGHINVVLGEGLNVMHNSIIYSNSRIGEGSLINSCSTVHHDVSVGLYCEIAPHACILGASEIGDYTYVGSNATILPKIKVGKNVVIGAGSVVTKDLPDNVTAVGVPAKIINKRTKY